jgi:hypothetical protein
MTLDILRNQFRELEPIGNGQNHVKPNTLVALP